MSLAISDRVSFPLDAVTQPFGILAMRGAGKSNAAVVMAEKMYLAGLPFVVIDPKGDWWGIRSNHNGDKPGLPIPVFGGLHADVPLEPGAGHLLAETVVELNLTCVLDVSEFNSKGDQIKFLTDFAERLFRLQGKTPQPRHLFLEEADEYIPQQARPAIARCVGAWTKIVKQGRSRGLGITLITQRSAVVSKDALTQIETLIVMRTTSPQDRKAVLGWVDYHSVGRELVDSLPELRAGEAWIVSPHWLKTIERVQFRQRTTFDSGATPVQGSSRAPATIADVDLGKLRDAMAGTIEKAEMDDPKRLHARIRDLCVLRDELQRDLKRALDNPPSVETQNVVPPGMSDTIDWVRDLGEELITRGHHLLAEADAMAQYLDNVLAEDGISVVDRPFGAQYPQVQVTQEVLDKAAAKPSSIGRKSKPAPSGDTSLQSGDRKVLAVLAQFPEGRTRRQLCMMTGYSNKASTIGNILARLRAAGFVERAGEPIRATAEGIEHSRSLGDVEDLPTGPALLEYWRQYVQGGDRQVLDVLVKRYPGEVPKDEMCAITGYSPDASTIGNIMARLRRLDLAEGWRAGRDFMEAIR